MFLSPKEGGNESEVNYRSAEEEKSFVRSNVWEGGVRVSSSILILPPSCLHCGPIEIPQFPQVIIYFPPLFSDILSVTLLLICLVYFVS